MMIGNQKKILEIRPLTSYVLLIIFLSLTFFVTFFLYKNIQNFFKEMLKERLLSVASTSSVLFSRNELDAIDGEKSIGTPAYENVVHKLQNIRSKNINLKYIYILRKTDDPNIFKFVADADSINPLCKDGLK